MPVQTISPRRPAKRAAPPSLGQRLLGGSRHALRALVAPVRARPVLAGSLFAFAVLSGWVGTNALTGQSGRHSHPLLATRPQPGDAAVDLPSLPVPLVKDVQDALAEAGYYTAAPDGRPGKATAAAIRAFQTDHGLAVDGDASPRLLAALRAAARPTDEETGSLPQRTERVASLETGRSDDASRAPVPAAAVPAAVPAGPSRDLVRRVQEGLRAAKVAELDADGIMGARTEAAIRTFQASQGLNVNGVPDEALAKRLKALGTRK
ncbi:hypothetical protein GCM10011390_10800 [Aureimonas endophytica]|uniref:Peptidoglycan binding-like domain-containing protein n=1 Tax=Aureimonas endophytica TaxID=2027858 RepID=A0A916ZG98_9HYPH|nr:peptidoglycan-binding domain-containing protein [Aureimonas endophytica]GGD93933.1 hypothetical protein GCM10011390_10800 [Aureimonas endophytica]